MTPLEFVKRFNKITTSGACSKLQIPRTTVIVGRSSRQVEEKLANELIEQCESLIKEYKESKEG